MTTSNYIKRVADLLEINVDKEFEIITDSGKIERVFRVHEEKPNDYRLMSRKKDSDKWELTAFSKAIFDYLITEKYTFKFCAD